LIENIHQVLHGIIGLHLNSATGRELSPSMLKQLGQFSE
jgi:hypothetical protein